MGRLDLEPGWYAYAGSALGPGGLAARTAHHLRVTRSPHWHVDYLRGVCQPVALWYATGHERQECAWASALAAQPGAARVGTRFGASDCRCPGHLIHMPWPPDLQAFGQALGQTVMLEALE